MTNTIDWLSVSKKRVRNNLLATMKNYFSRDNLVPLSFVVTYKRCKKEKLMAYPFRETSAGMQSWVLIALEVILSLNQLMLCTLACVNNLKVASHLCLLVLACWCVNHACMSYYYNIK